MGENRLVELLAELKDKEFLELFRKLVDKEDSQKLVEDLRRGLTLVGERFASKEYFLGDLMFSAVIFEEAMDILSPKIERSRVQTLGKVVIGTVEGDIHDLGKNIVVTMLKAAGFEVVDLGVDVKVKDFFRRVKEEKPDVVGMSGLLTLAFEPMKETIKLIRSEFEDMPIMVGGAVVDQFWADRCGADYYGKDAGEAVRIASKIVENKKGR